LADFLIERREIATHGENANARRPGSERFCADFHVKSSRRKALLVDENSLSNP
jgi:hypothetical protein